MSADRHALDAVLEHSHQLERQIERLKAEVTAKQRRINELSRQVSKAKNALHVGPDENPLQERGMMQNEATMCEKAEIPDYKNCGPEAPMEDCCRCKNCGAPV